MKRTFVLGDLHGGYKALLEVLQLAEFDYENDELIFMGDVCDGWSETPECMEELLKIKNLIFIIGNHDEWLIRFVDLVMNPDELRSWLGHGGVATTKAYENRQDLLAKHVAFLKTCKYFHVDSKNRAFVHAGVPNRLKPLDSQIDYCWDRSFYQNAPTWEKQGFKLLIPISDNNPGLTVEWFVGHTPTSNFKNHKANKPVRYANINFVDTGAAFDGCVTLMNVDTYEYVQSSDLKKLYPNERGRNQYSYNEANENFNKLW